MSVRSKGGDATEVTSGRRIEKKEICHNNSDIVHLARGKLFGSLPGRVFRKNSLERVKLIVANRLGKAERFFTSLETLDGVEH